MCVCGVMSKQQMSTHKPVRERERQGGERGRERARARERARERASERERESARERDTLDASLHAWRGVPKLQICTKYTNTN
jgi:hypothetical protein